MTVPGVVVDTSVLILALVGGDGASSVRERMRTAGTHAPHLIDAEAGSVLRRHERAGLLSSADAAAALTGARLLVGQRYPHAGPLSEAAWALRANLTFYDALYVALASRLGIPLLTADARVARAPGVTCTVEQV